MARIRSENRLEEIADAAVGSFTERGFSTVQVAQIAARAGVSPGTIYLYVPNKEALFFLALRRSLGLALPDGCRDAPLSEEAIAGFLAPSGKAADLNAALERLEPLGSVLDLAYAELWRLGPGIRLIEACARDWPALARIFYESTRTGFVERLARYLRRGEDAGIVRPIPFPDVSARLIVETLAWFTMHRLGDYDGRAIPDDHAREATIDALVHAFSPLPE